MADTRIVRAEIKNGPDDLVALELEFDTDITGLPSAVLDAIGQLDGYSDAVIPDGLDATLIVTGKFAEPETTFWGIVSAFNCSGVATDALTPPTDRRQASST